MMKDPMRCYITTDHPNAGPFTRYPRVIKWLMSKKALMHRSTHSSTRTRSFPRPVSAASTATSPLNQLAQIARACLGNPLAFLPCAVA